MEAMIFFLALLFSAENYGNPSTIPHKCFHNSSIAYECSYFLKLTKCHSSLIRKKHTCITSKEGKKMFANNFFDLKLQLVTPDREANRCCTLPKGDLEAATVKR